MTKKNSAYMVEVGAYKNEDGGFETVVTVCRENGLHVHENPSPDSIRRVTTWAWKKVSGPGRDECYAIEPMGSSEWTGFTVHIDE